MSEVKIPYKMVSYEVNKEARTKNGEYIEPYPFVGSFPLIGTDPNYIFIEHPSSWKGKLKDLLTRIFYPKKGILHATPEAIEMEKEPELWNKKWTEEEDSRFIWVLLGIAQILERAYKKKNGIVDEIIIGSERDFEYY